MSTAANVSDTQESHDQLSTTGVFILIASAIDRAQNEDRSQTIFVHEDGELFGITITVEPESDTIATYITYVRALFWGNQSIVGPRAQDIESDHWYRLLESRLRLKPAN